MNQPKWNDEREEQLKELVGSDTPVTKKTVETVSNAMGNSTRSIASKLRKMGFDVEKTGDTSKKFSSADEEAIKELITTNVGVYTFKDIAKQVLGDESMSKQVQGKVLSMELTDMVKKTEPKVAERKYTEDEEDIIVDMSSKNMFLEDIADALDKDIKSVRGKCLSMLKSHGILYPKTRDKVETEKGDVLSGLDSIETMTLKEVAEATGKSLQGIKVMLTHRAITITDYDGAKRAEKIAARKEAA